MRDAALLEHIAKLPHARANFKQLVRELGARGGGREDLENALARLTARGDLIELRSGHFAVTARSREFAVGRLHMHKDGYGFLIAERPIEGIVGDIFLPPESAEKAMHGDRVVVRIARIEPGGRADGEIVKILKRAQPTVVGEFRIGRRGQYVVPHDERIRQWIEIPEALEVPPAGPVVDRIGVTAPEVSSAAELNGMIVNVELLEYPERGSGPVGRVIEILGRPDDFGVDVEIIIRKHHLPHQFPPEVIEQAEAIPNVISAREAEGRRDFRSLEIVTIDGETARDFDDAVWVDRLPNGNYALQVHIADVSHYVRPGTPIDTEARLRGTSVYFPDRAVPMLPFELSTNICSLNPRVDRLVLSALLEIDHQGEPVAQEFTAGVIRSAERMTYTDVHLLLEGDAGLRERYQPLVPRFELMRELALVLNRKRVRRGSIDFDLPEPLIEFDEWGAMTGVTRAPRNIAHRLIEEFMLAANEAVASHLENAGIASLYRIHEKPDAKRVMEFEEVAAHFGYSLGIGAIPVKKFAITDRRRDGTKRRRDLVMADSSVSISSRHYQRLVSKIEGKPEERILSYLMLRSLKQARYSVENVGHFALAADSYTHFTSPIRRYPDLIVHRLLRAVLAGQTTPAEGELASIAEECSQSERRAADAERELVEWKKVKFMAERVGEDFDALIISTSKYVFFVELADLFVEGLVPIDTLPGDQYAFQENVRKIVGKRTRREFSIGDKVRVVLDRVDDNERKLQFSLLEEEPKPARGRRARKPVPAAGEGGWPRMDAGNGGILPAMANHNPPVSPTKESVTWLYPPVEPFNTGRLQVSAVHEIYFEESGNPSGKPVIFLHGGPGGGSDPKQRRFFHPGKYRIVNFDQRGCGKSTPYASLESNTTWDLVADIEKIREHLGIERWQVFGGSWGSTLALAYSQTHPDRVTELVLRGIFLLRKQEIDWFYQRGASVLYPDAWEPYLAHIPEAERQDLLSAYYRRLTSDDAAVRLAAAKIWSGWEGATSKLLPDAAFTEHYEEDEFALAFARIEAHYFVHRGFFETDDQLLRNASRIRGIPGVIVQGRYDVVCPMESAWALHRAWPEADLIITPDSGHSAFDPPNSRGLVAATDRFAG